jgi:type IV pilus assembly protein PilV
MRHAHLQNGTSLLEVLITVVVISSGLLGLAGLQTRLQVSQVESYQRSQALIIVQDMANRIQTNRGAAANYVTGAGNPVGANLANCPTTDAGSTQQEVDAAQWCASLQGAGEIFGGARAGALIGGRGCVEEIGVNQYLVTVAWQGLAPLGAPPEGAACGANSYNDGVACVDDRCRRVVTTIVQIADLT